MKYICLRCNRTSVDGNLWCQEKFCPAEDSPVIFESGEWFGDIEIVDLLTVLHASAIYEARRGGEKVYLKVAHQGCQDKLKREAKLLADLARGSQHPMLPVLLPPYAQARVRDFPYGKTAVNGQTRYYCVFRYTAGDLLRTILLRTPQPWYQHIGWIILGLADAITLLHQAQRLHLCLSPDVILVRYDKQQIPRPLLLDLGIASDAQEILRNWDRRWAPPAYTAP